jgi:hypothetical protein
MAGEKSDTRKTRLAAALKENLKRRKAQERAKAGTMGAAPRGVLQNKPEPGPKFAPKRD